jgi:hypothetical protein
VGAEGFEPPSTGFHHVESDSTRSDMGHRSSYSSLVSKPNGNHSHNWSPLGYQTTPYPRCLHSRSEASTSSSASELSCAFSSSSCATSSAVFHASSTRENFSSCVRLPLRLFGGTSLPFYMPFDGAQRAGREFRAHQRLSNPRPLAVFGPACRL